MGLHSMSEVSERFSIVSSSSIDATPDARLAAFTTFVLVAEPGLEVAQRRLLG